LKNSILTSHKIALCFLYKSMLIFTLLFFQTHTHTHTYCEQTLKFISRVKPTRCINVSNYFYFGMTLCMFRTVFPPIISSSRLYIQQPNRYCCLLANKQTAISLWQMPVAVCTVLNSWRWTERPSETCRVLFQKQNLFDTWCI